MDTGRLKAVVDEILAEATKFGLAASLQSFETAYQQYVGAPSAANATLVTQAFESMKSELADYPSNTYPPSKFKILDSIGGTAKTGMGIFNRLDEAFRTDQAIPANTLLKIQQIRKESTDFFAGLTQLTARFSSIGIEAPAQVEGEGEIGVTFPELTITEDLQSLAKEIGELDFAIATLSELFEDGTGSVEIKGISQGSPLVFHLLASPQMVKVFTGIISAILKIIAGAQAFRISEATIQKLYGQSDLAESEKKLKEAEKSLKDAEKEHVDLKIKQLRASLIEKSPMAAGQRKNELEAQTYHALVYIAQRIDRGVDWEASLPDFSSTTGAEPSAIATQGEVAASTELKKLSKENSSQFREIRRAGESVLNLDAHVEAVEFFEAVEKIKKKKRLKKRKKG